MAKRVSPEEKPYSPLEERYIRETLRPMLPPEGTTEQAEEVPPTPAPSSARVVNFPDHQAVASATLPSEQAEPKKEAAKPAETEKREKRVLLTMDEEEVLEQLVTDMGKRLKTSLTLSHVLRATTILLNHSRDELLNQCGKMAGMKRPSNKDAVALATFEHNLARLIDRAIRGSRLLE